MFTIRQAADRGHFDHGWLDTFHTFSFGEYHDPQHMHFRALRVMNEDFVAAGHGFPTHPHRDMEIITYVLAGQLEHRDSLGYGEVIRPGEVQRLSAGTGIRHSEFNPSTRERVHLYQIWIMPDRVGHTPRYEQKPFPEAERVNRWQTIASPDGRAGSIPIHQDVTIHLANLTPQHELAYEWTTGRFGWLQVLRGTLQTGEQFLQPGDGLAIQQESRLVLTTPATVEGPAEVMLFDLQ